jgi:hypothetical protein
MDERLSHRLNPKRSLPEGFTQRLKRNREKETLCPEFAPEKLE